MNLLSALINPLFYERVIIALTGVTCAFILFTHIFFFQHKKFPLNIPVTITPPLNPIVNTGYGYYSFHTPLSAKITPFFHVHIFADSAYDLKFY